MVLHPQLCFSKKEKLYVIATPKLLKHEALKEVRPDEIRKHPKG